MNGTRTYEASDDDLLRDFDYESYDDDDDPYESAEAAVRDHRASRRNVASSIGNFIRRPGRPPLPTISAQPTGQGVSTANLQTPAGNATLRLPEPVPSREEFRTTIQRLEEAVNRNTARLNTTQGDIAGLNERLLAIGNDLTGEDGKLRSDTRRVLERFQRQQRAVLARLRRQQSSQQTNSMLISLLLQQQLQKRIDEHTHALPEHTHAAPSTADPTKTGGVSSAATVPAPAAASGSNNALLFLPMMMAMGQDGGDAYSGDPYSGGSNYTNAERSSGMEMMMPMMMMLALK